MQGWGEANSDAPALPGSFSACSLGSKALIVAAGPLANLILEGEVSDGDTVRVSAGKRGLANDVVSHPQRVSVPTEARKGRP